MTSTERMQVALERLACDVGPDCWIEYNADEVFAEREPWRGNRLVNVADGHGPEVDFLNKVFARE